MTTDGFHPDALYLAVQIQRRFAPEHWGREIDRLPPGEIQDTAREYLRGIYRRMQVVAKASSRAARDAPDGMGS